MTQARFCSRVGFCLFRWSRAAVFPEWSICREDAHLFFQTGSLDVFLKSKKQQLPFFLHVLLAFYEQLQQQEKQQQQVQD